ncbi:MAG TPA: hypothetical protein DCM87_20075 [Planctomycetes bacterium]|nr:hypothetical protein [Planctomycetota bacterium]
MAYGRVRGLVLIGCAALGGSAAAAAGAREQIDLCGIWEVLADADGKGLAERWYEPDVPAGAWQPIAVPGSWETVLGTKFDTVAWYRKTVPVPASAAGRCVLLRFHGAATEARVWVNGREAGSHIGAWTPFTFDVTSSVTPGAAASVVVRLDEKVGHNTQGFLPIVAPHFGGLWQPVELLLVGRARLDDMHARIDAAKVDPATGNAVLSVTVPVIGAAEGEQARFLLFGPDGAYAGGGDAPLGAGGSSAFAAWRWEGRAALWDIGAPNLYTLAVSLPGDRAVFRFGFREASADGHRVRLNGREVIVRGVLNWGVYPPLLAPAPEKERFRRQLRYLRSCGFNLIKFCLWLPPKELLAVADEEGMLSWIEYPTWHPVLDKAHRDELVREYTEFADHDGRAASAVIRSITCETGASADLDVLREIYTLLKQACPGTLVEDDSSWIGWNRIHDFWDDHPYGNNRTWRGVLRGFAQHIETHGVKPFLLGEAIAADTWTDTRQWLDHSVDARPWWAPNWLDDQLRFERCLEARFARPGLSLGADLRAAGRKYAMDMRRWQVETFRETMPHSGYVITVIRDTRLANMGFLDDFDAPKWTAGEWGWHGAIVVPFPTRGDRRAFGAGEILKFTPCVRVAADGRAAPEGTAVWRGPAGGRVELAWRRDGAANGISAQGPEAELPLPAEVARPAPGEVVCAVSTGDALRSERAWEVWTLPAPRAVPAGLVVYGDDAGKGLAAMFPGAAAVDAGAEIPEGCPAVVTCALSAPVLAYLERGGSVFHITAPVRGSFRDEEIWFLRGMAWAPPAPEAFFERVPREMLAYLQLFELGGGSIIRGEGLWEQVDPLLAFLETHDLHRVRPNLMLFQTAVGRGRLAVSCLRHEGPDNRAGAWLARELADYLVSGPAPSRALSPEAVAALAESLSAETVRIPGPWRFAKDPNDRGVAEEWFGQTFDVSAWQDLAAHSAEEGAIWNAYDGWAWYRTTIAVPAAWKGRRAKIVFDSVDDMYEIYVNGKKAGGYGKLDRTESSYLNRTSVDITACLAPGEENLLALRVYDWGGGGGIGGAAALTTGPVEEGLDLLRR